MDININNTRNFWVFLPLGLLWCFLAFYIFNFEFTTLPGPLKLLAAVLLSGSLLEGFFAISNRKIYPGWSWFLGIAIMDILFSFLFINLTVLEGSSAAELAILALYLSLCLLLHNTLSLIYTWELQKVKAPGAIVMFIPGIIGLISAVMILFNPLTGNASLRNWIFVSFLALGLLNIGQFISFSIRRRKGNIK